MFWIAKAAFTEIHLFRAIFSCIREQFIHITFLSLTFLVSRYRRGGISNIKMQNSITELYMCVCIWERERGEVKRWWEIYIHIPYIYINIWWCILSVTGKWMIWHSTDKLLQPGLKHYPFHPNPSLCLLSEPHVLSKACQTHLCLHLCSSCSLCQECCLLSSPLVNSDPFTRPVYMSLSVGSFLLLFSSLFWRYSCFLWLSLLTVKHVCLPCRTWAHSAVLHC